MKKVNVLLVIAGLFITGVMVYLMMSGVSLKERRMVKWSLVSGPAKAGDKVAGFMYPIMKESDSLQFIGDGDFYETFVQEFTARAKRDGVETPINQSLQASHPEQRVDRDEGARIHEPREASEGSHSFTVFIQEINKERFLEDCKAGKKTACIGIKALRKFAKKDRDVAPYWITMYRLSKDKSVIYYLRGKNE